MTWRALALGAALGAVVPALHAAPAHAAGGAPQVVLAPAASAAPQVSVSGNRLVDAAGRAVHLTGADRSGTEYACVQGWGIFDGPADAASVAAMASWHVNAVRVPLNEDCWLGINGVPAALSGSAYRSAIAGYVALLHAAGMVAILDLHWTAPGGTPATAQQPMPDADHAPAFWSSVATAFGADRSTLFDLFNEPYPDANRDTIAAWTCWRDGGSACPGLGYTAAGMQSLVDAVRGTGATNVLLLGGVEYANALDRWRDFAPSDPLGQLAASFHMYGGNACSSAACWDSTVAPLAASVPVVTGEFGESYLGNDCSTSLVNAFMGWADHHAVGYLAWTWNTWTQCGVLISDDAGTPTAFGAAVRAHYLALAATPSPLPRAPGHCPVMTVFGSHCGPSAPGAPYAGVAAARRPAPRRGSLTTRGGRRSP